MARKNARRRAQEAARKAVMAERNASHPGGKSPKGMSYSPIHLNTMLAASHTPGFTGLGRSVGRTTKVLSRKGNLEKSRIDMAATSNFGKPMPAYQDVRPTAPMSKRFAEDDYPNDEMKRQPVKLERRERVPGKRGMKWGQWHKPGTRFTTFDAPYHPGKTKGGK